MAIQTDLAGPDELGRLRAVRRRRVLAVAGVSLGALLLAACSGGSAPVDASGSAGSPQKGGTLRVAISDAEASESLDPGLILSTNSATMLNAIYDPLVTLAPDRKVVPGLAKSWDVSPDAKQFTLHLQDGVKWQDGSPFSSTDVVFTIKRWVDPKAGNAMLGTVGAYLDASGVSAPDASTVVLKLKAADAALMASIAANFANKITKAGTTKFTAATSIGTGPFKLTSWVAGSSWSMVRNDAYWRGAPNLDGIQATVTPDQGAKVQGILGGSSQVTDTIPISLWPSLQSSSNVKLETIKAKNAFIFAFDQRKAPYNDPRVVEALKLATDRDTILKTALQGHGVTVADLAVVPDSPYYPTGLKPEFDPAKAKALLAEAGFANGLDIELSTNPDLPGMVDVAQAWQQAVKAAGINVTLKQYPGGTYWSDAWMATPAFMDYWNYYPPEGLFDLFYKTGAVWNEPRFSDPKLDAQITALQSEVDDTKRIALAQEAELSARDTFAYVIPVYADAAFAHAPNVHGVVWSYVDTLDFRQAWIG